MRRLKSLSSLKKRVKRTATGAFVHRPSGTSHNNANKSRSRKRRLHRNVLVEGSLRRRVRRLLPNA